MQNFLDDAVTGSPATSSAPRDATTATTSSRPSAIADGNPYDAYLPPDPGDTEGFMRPEAGEAP